jgi:hypothetical protein
VSESLNDKLEAVFKARPYEWIDGKELAEIAGGYAWRTRVSNLRTQRGMEIGNDVVKRWDAQGKPYKTSYYRYVPDLPTRVEPSGQVAFL